MSISVTCSHCDGSFRAPDVLAGRRGKCPKCGQAISVPASATATAAPDEPILMAEAVPSRDARPPSPIIELSPATAARHREILSAFRGPIEPVQTSVAYHFGAVLVALVMVLLPLVYVALIVLAAWGVYFHAVNSVGMLGAVRGRGAIIMLCLYAAPLVAGPILVLFMIKPLFARATDDGRRRSITRNGEPLRFALVDRICQTVGAPVPKRIDVDCSINAAAGFRRGLWSMLFGNDLILLIGLPLISGLELRQFAGVLAHEFGHF